MTQKSLSLQEILDGQIILIDKPLHWSSFQTVNKLKWAILKKYKIKKIKIGHAGTLDPLATGLLIICTGKFTKKIQQIQDAPKGYTGVITLGAATPSYDMETQVNITFPTEHITAELVKKARMQFLGKIEQQPPIFSALKKDGKRLYEFAREGKDIEIKARTVYIETLNFQTDKLPNTLPFEVYCSKGTYIRSLADSFGRALQSGGFLSELRRIKIGEFSVENALSPDDFITKYIDNG
ncbi:tRNA pseudouridine(55) synthase TruB [Capnocytophaga catalasegens]|uniref:tRNA pseudouridine synthase B n=1 Tax=Capnocytophaga catalasegens TaxID=1004260 RepID=A0AAV5AZK4_9FLAO|nr:tRNA pseudouridine(55) synthase TruB [Capnocytophaga catalasegens]GIZ15392.1 tRNA pseudouridine synthase B [Capnocytophaga catalasegens]GJM50980.1 tRNA pseudouridine synthase B [Capnocytophaga catalasegens]GJM52164.1 tRNA pseudouridine synthase B [Capnocytophaga catalasegens]